MFVQVDSKGCIKPFLNIIIIMNQLLSILLPRFGKIGHLDPLILCYSNNNVTQRVRSIVLKYVPYSYMTFFPKTYMCADEADGSDQKILVGQYNVLLDKSLPSSLFCQITHA